MKQEHKVGRNRKAIIEKAKDFPQLNTLREEVVDGIINGDNVVKLVAELRTKVDELILNKPKKKKYIY